MIELNKELVYRIIPAEDINEAVKIDSLLNRITNGECYTRLRNGKGPKSKTTFHVWLTEEESEFVNKHLYPGLDEIDWDFELCRILDDDDGIED